MRKYYLGFGVLFCVASYLVSVKLPSYSAPKPIHGKIQFFEEDAYWSIYHFYGLAGGVKKEVAVSAFNQNMEEVEYVLLVESLDARGMSDQIVLGKSKSQSFKKTVEIPLLSQNQQLKFLAGVKDSSFILDEAINEEKTMPYTFSLTATHLPDPLTYGMFLIPKKKVFVLQGGKLNLRAELLLPYGKKKNISWSLSLMEPKIILKSEVEDIEEICGEFVWNYEGIELPKLSPGKYTVVFAVKDTKDNTTLINEERTLLVALPVKDKTFFGAHKTKINYTEPVYIHSDQKNYTTKSWDELWVNGPHDDIVVNFPQGFKLLFWRGASYIPIFTFGNIGMTFEWIEAAGSWGRPAGTKVKDCVEPLMDKECRFSRVKIISSTPARVVIHWRYALIDLNYYNPDNEWVDEYYYIYPDGYATRVADAKLVPNTWHEESEFIVLIPPGYNPFELIEGNDVTIYNLNGTKKWEVTHPKPNIQWEVNQPAVYRVHLKNNPYSPVMVTPNLEKQSTFDGWQNKKRYVSPSYWGDHWPVTRGFETRNFVPEFYKVRPTHASLVSTYHKPLKVTPTKDGMEMTMWVWLIGITKAPDDVMLQMARNFLTPPVLVPMENVRSAAYDMKQRAYVLAVKKGTTELTFSLKSKSEEIIHVAFIVKDAVKVPSKVRTVQALINNKLLKKELVSYGAEGKDAVIFLNTRLRSGDSVKFVLK